MGLAFGCFRAALMSVCWTAAVYQPSVRDRLALGTRSGGASGGSMTGYAAAPETESTKIANARRVILERSRFIGDASLSDERVCKTPREAVFFPGQSDSSTRR